MWGERQRDRGELSPSTQTGFICFFCSLVRSRLFPDGVFLLRLIMTNFGLVICAEILNLVWTEFTLSEKKECDGILVVDQNGKVPNLKDSPGGDVVFFEEEDVPDSPGAERSTSSTTTTKTELKDRRRPTGKLPMTMENDGFREFLNHKCQSEV